MFENLLNFLNLTAFASVTVPMVIMWIVCLVLLYLGVYKQFEPLLLIPIAFGGILANLPTQGIVNEPADTLFAKGNTTVLEWKVAVGDKVEKGQVLARLAPDENYPEGRDLLANTDATVTSIDKEANVAATEGQALVTLYQSGSAGLFYYISRGVKWEIFPPLIFLGVGAMTDFGPLIARPITLLLGAAAQFGVVATFLCASLFLGFSPNEAASIGIIGGADGPTAIFTTSKLAPHLLSAVAVAAYSYMALVPLIQPPIMRLLTTKKERTIRMTSLRPVSKLERLIFALIVTVLVILLVPAASPLIAMLMLGNFLRECQVTERLVKAAQNELMNIVTIFLGVSVGITMTGDNFLKPSSLKIILLGVIAFCLATAAGVIMAKVLNLFLRKKLNPLIGSAGVSAVPMAARVSQVEGQKADPKNFLLMHAMGPNVAGVIGSAVIAGYFIATLGN